MSRRGAMVVAGGALAVGLLVGLAGPASAHTADATVSQTCVNGTSQSTVQFNNNFDVPATLSYSGPASGSLALPPMVGSTPGINSVTVTVYAPSTLTYRVRWDDGVAQGDRSVPLEPVTDCLPASTTTAPTVTVAPTTPPTTTPPSPTTAQVLPTSVVASPATTAAIAPPVVPAAAPVSNRTPLPATGTDSTGFVVGGVILVVAGALLFAAGRWADHA